MNLLVTGMNLKDLYLWNKISDTPNETYYNFKTIEDRIKLLKDEKNMKDSQNNNQIYTGQIV